VFLVHRIFQHREIVTGKSEEDCRVRYTTAAPSARSGRFLSSAGSRRENHSDAAVDQALIDIADGIGARDKQFFASRLVATVFGGWPLPVNMIFDQKALTCAGDMPAVLL
jgi:hypothetical protein